MSLTQSKFLETGTQAPDFSLVDTVSGNILSLEDVRWTDGTVVMFICNHCPFVLHINDILVELGNYYKEKWVNFVAISSNDIVTHPQDSPEFMKALARDLEYPFPYLYDASQEVAKAYHAVCTPDIFFFDTELKLAYHGQIDNSRPGSNIPVSWNDLKNAIDSYLDSGEIIADQKPSMGCNIKWR